MMLGIAIGLIIGVFLIELAIREESRINEQLKKTINNLEKDLEKANLKIKNRNNFISDYQEEHEILLKNISRSKEKIIDLENNIELLINNLLKQNKELSNKFGIDR